MAPEDSLFAARLPVVDHYACVRHVACNRRRTNKTRSRNLDASKNRMGRSRSPGRVDQ